MQKDTPTTHFCKECKGTPCSAFTLSGLDYSHMLHIASGTRQWYIHFQVPSSFSTCLCGPSLTQKHGRALTIAQAIGLAKQKWILKQTNKAKTFISKDCQPTFREINITSRTSYTFFM